MVPSKVKEIKQSFRQMMDGSIAQSMRDKGLNYHLNWGATLPRLQEMAKELGWPADKVHRTVCREKKKLEDM